MAARSSGGLTLVGSVNSGTGGYPPARRFGPGDRGGAGSVRAGELRRAVLIRQHDPACIVPYMDAVVDIHSWYRWVVLVVLLGAGITGLVRASRGTPWTEGAERPFVLATILMDLQIAVGIVLWIGNEGWDQDFFIKVIHPLGMLLAAAVAHTAVLRARKAAAASSYRAAGIGLLASLAVVAAVVPRDAWF